MDLYPIFASEENVYSENMQIMALTFWMPSFITSGSLPMMVRMTRPEEQRTILAQSPLWRHPLRLLVGLPPRKGGSESQQYILCVLHLLTTSTSSKDVLQLHGRVATLFHLLFEANLRLISTVANDQCMLDVTLAL